MGWSLISTHMLCIVSWILSFCAYINWNFFNRAFLIVFVSSLKLKLVCLKWIGTWDIIKSMNCNVVLCTECDNFFYFFCLCLYFFVHLFILFAYLWFWFVLLYVCVCVCVYIYIYTKWKTYLEFHNDFFFFFWVILCPHDPKFWFRPWVEVLDFMRRHIDISIGWISCVIIYSKRACESDSTNMFDGHSFC